jgi:hypothetical protein
MNTLTRIALGGLILLAFALRLYRLDAQSLWSDEGLSIYRAGQDAGFILSGQIFITGVPSQDTHPPLYFLLLHGLIAGAGRGEFAAKSLSVFFSILVIPLLAVAGHRLFGPAAGLLAALFGAISPLYLWYAQELRMYTMVVFLGLLSVYSLWRALEGLAGGASARSTLTWVGAYLLATAAVLYTHYSGFFLLAFEGLAVAAFAVRWRHAWLIAILTLAVLAAIPLALVALPRLQSGPEAGYRFVPLPDILLDLTNAFSLGISVDFRQVFLLDLVFLAMFLLGLVASLCQADRRAAGLFVAGYALVPVLALYLGSAVKPMYLGVRHLIVVSPAFYLGLAAGLNGLRVRWRPAFAGCLLLFLGGAAYSTANAYYSPDYLKDDLRSLVRYLELHTYPGDVILLRDPVISHVFAYYYRGQVPWQALPRYGDTVGPDTYATLERLTGEYDRIWSVYGPPGFFEDPQGLVKRWLDERLYKVDNVVFHAYGTNVAAAAYLTRSPLLDGLPAGLTPVGAQVGDGLVLLGYDLPHGRPVAGTTCLISFYWQVEQRLRQDYKLALRLVDDAGQVWGGGDQFPFGGLHDTSDWKPGPVIRVDHELSVTPGTPPGRYRLVLRVYRPDSGQALDVITADGQPVGQAADLGPVEVTRGAVTTADVRPAHRADARWQAGVRLLGYEATPAWLRPGETLAISLFFQVEQTPVSDLRLYLELVDSAGRSRTHAEAFPVGDGYPPTAWQPGDVLRGQHRLTVPPDAGPGDYRLRIRLVEPGGQTAPVRSGWWPLNVTSVTLSVVHVRPVERTTHVPAMAHPLQAGLGDAVELLGYDGDAVAVQPGGTISVTLYWRATAALSTSYKVTVQLVSDANQVVGQQDSVPANWTRPTAGWLPGEVVADPHLVPVRSDTAPGRYTLITALYQERTGQRLSVRQDDVERDHIVLSPVEVK